MLKYDQLKARQRAEREGYPENLSLRVHRALSWLNRAEQCEDDDGRFIFLWIAFNAAYSNEAGEHRVTEGRRVSDFLARLVDIDAKNLLADIVWNHYSGAIRLLLDNPFVFQPYWDFHNKLPNSNGWNTQFEAAKRASNIALANRDTAAVLSIVFNRLYTLRNQLIHGGATYDSQINRKQLNDASRLLQDVVPCIISLMMDNAQLHWGEACYPVVS